MPDMDFQLSPELLIIFVFHITGCPHDPPAQLFRAVGVHGAGYVHVISLLTTSFANDSHHASSLAELFLLKLL